MTLWFNEEEDQKARDVLLKYYSSECTVHGSYIVTVGIGFFAFLQVVAFIQERFVYPEWFVSFILSIFITIGIYLTVRTIFWGTLASFALHVREIGAEEVKIDNQRDRDTLLFRLHSACIKYFKKHHSHLNWLVGVEKGYFYNIVVYGVILIVLTIALVIVSLFIV